MIPRLVHSLVAILPFVDSASPTDAQDRGDVGTDDAPGTVQFDLTDRVSSDDIALVGRIREIILETSKTQTAAEMLPYKGKIPLTGAPYEMVNIPGGSFLMGSPPDEHDRRDDEGPQRRITVEPFWMGKFEVTWLEFEPFLLSEIRRGANGIPRTLPKTAVLPDFVSSPSLPYLEMDFGMGKEAGYPAISMTHHAACKYCQWLSAQTGHFYRLPTEAEWEYACRAGSTTAYYFGDSADDLADFAWYWHPSGPDKYARVGQKKPNAWGLFDMLGNVSEWCLDQYRTDAYKGDREHVPAVDLYPRVYRGGSWDDDPEDLRSARRFASSADLIRQDPSLPKSIWHNTDAQFLGFRIVRPLVTPSTEEMDRLWNCGDVLENKEWSDRVRAERSKPIPRND